MANIYNSQLVSCGPLFPSIASWLTKLQDAFTLYHKVQEAQSDSEPFLSPNGTALPALGHAIAGSAGAAISNLCTYPLELIITRLQIQRQLRKDRSTPSDIEYGSLRDAVQKIYSNEGGLAGFYTGVLQDTGKTIADSFFFFLAYTFLRSRRIAARRNGSSEAVLPAIEELTVGFMAGSFTKLLTTPIANIVTRKQASVMTSAKSDELAREQKTSQIAHDILNEKGILGFWSGYSASLILTLNPSLTFFLFETFKRLLPRSQRSNPPAVATFFMAAFSKACASALTYPFSLTKSRAQAGGREEEESEKQDLDEDIKDASGGAISGGRKQRAAAQSTIFSTLLEIVRNEGYQGLYEGLHLEIAKGFFSHGITMIVKQAIYKLIVQAYYVLAIIISRYKSRADPEALAQSARQQSYEYYDLARARAAERVAAAKEQMREAQKSASGLMDSVTGGVKGAMDSAMDRANETAELVADYVEEETEEWRSLYGTGLAKWFDEK
jgi:Mitochondrial carrier protein